MGRSAFNTLVRCYLLHSADGWHACNDWYCFMKTTAAHRYGMGTNRKLTPRPSAPAPLLQGLAAWFRNTGKIVTAPIELTEEDVRIVSSARQSRVRDSLLV